MNKVHSFNEFRGYQTLMVLRESFGGIQWWCGYVRLDRLADVDIEELDVHGGITWDKVDSIFDSNNRRLTPPNERWIGFDCRHCRDNILIQDQAYVKDQLEKLVLQLEAQASRTHYNTNAPHGAD